MSTLHVFTTHAQPATGFMDACGELPVTFTNPPRRQISCDKCRRRRWASRLDVRVYYDGWRFTCRDKAQCKREVRPARRKQKRGGK